MFERPTTKESLLSLVEVPKSYTDLKLGLGITDKAVQQHLADLTDFVEKNQEGNYILTDKGKTELDRLSSVRRRQRQFEELSGIHGISEFFRPWKVPQNSKSSLRKIDKELVSAKRITSQLAVYGTVMGSVLQSRYGIAPNPSTALAFSLIYSSIDAAHFLIHNFALNWIRLNLSDSEKPEKIGSNGPLEDLQEHLNKASDLLSNNELWLGEDFKKIAEFAREDLEETRFVLRRMTRLSDLRSEWKKQIPSTEKLNNLAANLIYLKELLERKLDMVPQNATPYYWGGRSYKTWLKMLNHFHRKISSTVQLLLDETKRLESVISSAYQDRNEYKRLSTETKAMVEKNFSNSTLDSNNPSVLCDEILNKADEMQKAVSDIPSKDYLEPFLARIAPLVNRVRKEKGEYEDWNNRHSSLYSA